MNDPRTMSAAKFKSGFTLIELMVALVLGLLVIAGVSAIFLGGSRNYREDERIARMHDNARFAVSELSQEVEMAGHWAEQFFPPDIFATSLNPAAGADCGPIGVQWKYVTTPAIEVADNVTGATANAAFSCISAGEVAPNTDVISIKRLNGSPTRPSPPSPAAPASLATGKVYLRTNNAGGALFMHNGTTSPTSPSDAVLAGIVGTTADWEYQVAIYYVRNFFATAGDGIPSLCRKLLQGVDVVADTAGCIPGIENLQLETGIDTDDDGVANFYVAAPTAAQFPQIVSVRALVLARTANPLGGYVNAKTYALSNFGNFSPNNSFPRELISATVLIRNAAALSLY